MLSMINSGTTILGQLTTDKTADTCMSRRFPDTATYWPKIAKFSHRSFIRSSRYGWFRLNFATATNGEKTRMIRLFGGKGISTICLAVLARYRSVMDGRTDKQTTGTAISISHVAFIHSIRFHWNWTSLL